MTAIYKMLFLLLLLVVLHNLCEMYDNCISEWTVTEVGADSSTSSTAVCLNANTIRNAIAMYIPLFRSLVKRKCFYY